ncbi:Acetyltransferase, GNAT family [Shewanella piezotolerans WP3]|uniref:Acetyltransferase, GNAT family n=1 Tax=Shewanella piezotolerans (strain WP3 / JCM 13877) TaxID=225849 RepID=B8CRR0_SHEPW|nr:GNAT family N-acetyltransferase [Shewanella piezotolerans]ACJ30068.1 Acetyltransferase, GNAT family [Shewanella piezotolerans WP3]
MDAALGLRSFFANYSQALLRPLLRRYTFKDYILSVMETDRLEFREINSKDLIDLRLVLSDPEVMKYSIVGVHNDSEIQKYIDNCQQQYRANGFGQWAIFSKSDASFVGVCGLNSHVVESNDLLHVSYRLASSQQGKGFASEATIAVAEFCKHQLKLDNISALIDPENIPSLKVAKRAGFLFRKSSAIQGFNVDIYQMAFVGEI